MKRTYLLILTAVFFLISVVLLSSQKQELPSSKHAKEQGIGVRNSPSSSSNVQTSEMAPLFRSDAEKATAGGFDPNDEEEGTIGGASPLPIGDGVAPLLFFATLYFGVTLHKKCLTHDKN